MAGRIPAEFIDELLARTDIVDLIHQRIPLRKAGRDYQACCPFHDEKTPSFTVSRDKQFYHCFGCGAHGTAIGFLMEYERQAFPDAVEWLAQEAGVEMPHSGESRHRGPDPRPCYALTEQAATLFRQQLRHHPQAVAYLRRRGLSGEMAAAFGLGYAPPGWDFLLSRLGQEEGARAHLVQCGLAIAQEDRGYDRFRDRLMFPIRDRRGRSIGFGGRLLGDGQPKYLNSPETPIFHKGRELYGLHEALQAQRAPERLLVVEGYLDVIALAQFGLRYAVATLGTATTAEQVRRLRPHASELVFCFDGDRAGREAAWKALHISLPQATGQPQIRFLFLPEGEDPDTLIRKEGAEAFEQRIRHARPLSEWLFARLREQADPSSLDGKAQFATLAAPLIARVPQGLFRDLLERRVAELTGVTSPRRAAAPPRRPSPPLQVQATTPLRLAIALLLQHPHLAALAAPLADDWRQLDKPGIGLLGELLDLLAAYPDILPAALLERWRDRDPYPHLQRLAAPPLLAHIPEDGLGAELTGALQRLNQEARSARQETLFRRASPADWTEEEKEILRKGIGERSGGPLE